jgi:transcriptional regulator with PAS, ATPase and Fis domain
MTSRRLELLVVWQDRVRPFPLPEQGEVTIGRAEDNQIRIDNPSVSRHHAVLSVGVQTTIRDLGGTNGVLLHAGDVGGAVPDTVGLTRLLGESGKVAIGESVMLGGVMLVLRRAAAGPDATPANQQIACDGPVKALYREAELAARSNISVLILGETGVGKEVLARAIHARSERASAPFMGINCAALSGTLLEGELFGYERGAFTGAVQARPGLFEAAGGGTVFLDELGELPLETQAKLLRIIEERSVMRLGSRTPRPINVRFVCATNRDLEQSVHEECFRADLFYRINGITLRIPPLRERRADIEPLARSLLQALSRQLDRAAPEISPDAMELLLAHHWPGNVRELRNVLERCVVLCHSGTIRKQDLPEALWQQQPRARPPEGRDTRSSPPMRQELKELERTRIIEALARCHGNQSAAAKLLGISRRTLVARLSEFNLPRPRKDKLE